MRPKDRQGQVALSQDAPYQAPKTPADIRVTTIMGTVQEDGEKLRFVTEQRAWKVDNPDLLRGHEGHYVHAAAYIYPDKNLIHIIEVKNRPHVRPGKLTSSMYVVLYRAARQDEVRKTAQ